MSRSILRQLVLPTLLLATSSVALAQTIDATSVSEKSMPVNVSFVPGIGVDDAFDGDIVTNFSLNILGGRTSRLEGLELGSVLNWQSVSATGAQLAGVTNLVDGPVVGGQLAGVFNTSGRLTGAQLAGVTNIASEPVTGAQLAGIFNLAGESMRGVQIAGIANSAQELRGAQLGVVNYARKAHGLQLGVVNVSDENDGVPIGLFNYVADVPLHLDAWVDDMRFANLGVRSGTRDWYTILSAGVRPEGDSSWLAVSLAFGRHIDLGGDGYMTVDLMSRTINQLGDWRNLSSHSALRIIGGYDLGLISLFAGPTFNLHMSEDGDGAELVPYTIIEESTDGVDFRGWVGFVAGVRF